MEDATSSEPAVVCVCHGPRGADARRDTLTAAHNLNGYVCKRVARAGPAAKDTREGLLQMMREQIPVLGRQMTRNQFSKAAGVSTATIERLGNWSSLRKELGLTNRRRAKGKSFAEAMGVELFDNAALLGDFSAT